VQDTYYVRRELSDDDKAALHAILRSAPDEELATHRTLRRASALPPDAATRLNIMFFSRPEVSSN
jgi:hypothetical protein